MVRIFLFVIILFCEPLIGFSFGETSYFDQNGNPVSKEEYEKISKKKAEKPSAQSPDATQAKPKPVTTEQKQPIPPVQQTRSESQEDIRKKILDAYSKIPPIVYKPGSQDTYQPKPTPLLKSTVHTDESLEYKLATINAGSYVSTDHITVARFRSLLSQLSTTYVENKQQIADMTVKAQQLLLNNGVNESLLNMMEGMNHLFQMRVENQKFAEYIAAYVALRSEGQSHSETVLGLKAILRSLGVK